MNEPEPKMEVVINGKKKLRSIESLRRDYFGLSRYEPRLRSNEGVMHMLDGTTIIYKLHD